MRATIETIMEITDRTIGNHVGQEDEIVLQMDGVSVVDVARSNCEYMGMLLSCDISL